MGFFTNFFKKRPKEPETFTINMFGKDFTVDISESARLKYGIEYEELLNNAWKGTNEIERIRDDGYIIYKSNWVNVAEKELIGFYGLKRYSNNNKYCVVYVANKESEYNISLVEVESKVILFKTKLQRPHRCFVSNNGFVICEDWEGTESANCSVYLINKSGEILKQHKHSTGIGDLFDFFDDETMFRYNINSTGEIHEIKII